MLINLINKGKTDVDVEKVLEGTAYNSFLINRSLSLHIDSVIAANEANKYEFATPQMHYDFLVGVIPPRARFGKWPKPRTNDKVDIIQRFFQISKSKAEMYDQFFDDDQIKRMTEMLEEIGL